MKKLLGSKVTVFTKHDENCYEGRVVGIAEWGISILRSTNSLIYVIPWSQIIELEEISLVVVPKGDENDESSEDSPEGSV